MKLDVVERYGRTFISFWNSMPDSQQILAAQAVEASREASGTLRFEFEDGWGNIGEGRLTRGGEVTLTLIRPSADPLASNVGRNYGRFQLRRGACGFG